MQKGKKLHMFKTLYKSYLMNISITTSARTIMGSPLSYFKFKNINSFTTLYSDGAISHVFGPKNLKELEP